MPQRGDDCLESVLWLQWGKEILDLSCLFLETSVLLVLENVNVKV